MDKKVLVILVQFQPCCLTCYGSFAVVVGSNARDLTLGGMDVCVCVNYLIHSIV